MPVEEAGSFTYASQPHSAPTNRTASSHYREETAGVPLTLMSDPRVIRGNTHSLARKVTKSKTEMSRSMTLNFAQNRAREQNTVARPTYNYEVKSFSNNEIDVSKFLVQQNENGPMKKEAENQTNEFVPRPQTPEYVPRKTGIDRSTQVEDVRELFNFDIEVVPLLEVIVRKTMEQSLFEVQCEEELKLLDKTANDYLHEHDVESEWTKRKETQAIKEYNETQSRIAALKDKKKKELSTKSLIAGLQMMRQIMPDAVEALAQRNLKSGLWKEPAVVEARSDVLPPVVHNAFLRMNAHSSAEAVVDGESFYCAFIVVCLNECFMLVELLLAAQDRFTSFPRYQPPKETRKVLLNMKFINNDNSGAAAEDEEAGSSSKKKPEDNSVTVTFPVTAQDTILTLERRIRAELTRLKVPPVVDENSTEPPPAFDAVFASKLPEPNTNMNLRKRFTDLIYSPVTNREIAKDAILWNFTLPASIVFEVVNSS